jgi:hypothetical protein
MMLLSLFLKPVPASRSEFDFAPCPVLVVLPHVSRHAGSASGLNFPLRFPSVCTRATMLYGIKGLVGSGVRN